MFLAVGVLLPKQAEVIFAAVQASSALEAAQQDVRFEVRTYFSNGSRGYDLMGTTRDQIISDVLVQFERFLQIVQAPEAKLVTTAPELPPAEQRSR